MGKRNSRAGRAVSIPVGLTTGLMVSIVVTVTMAAILAKLMDMERISWSSVGYGVLITLLVASYSGAAVSAGRIKRRKLLVCFEAGAAYFGTLLMITVLFFGAQFEAVGVTAGLIMAGSVSAGLIGSGKRGGKTRKKNRVRC